MIERGINAWLARFPKAQAELTALDGHSMQVVIEDWDVCVHVAVVAHKLAITWQSQAADVTLQGSGESLLSFLKIGWLKQARVPHTGLNIQGPLHIAQGFQALFSAVPWELEPHLAHWIGDRQAYLACRVAHKAASRLGGLAQEVLVQLSDYQAYESDAWADADDVREFCDAVDQLRYRIERLEAQMRGA